MKSFSLGLAAGIILTSTLFFFFGEEIHHGHEPVSSKDKALIDAVIAQNSIPNKVVEAKEEAAVDESINNLFNRATALMPDRANENEIVSLLEEALAKDPKSEKILTNLSNYLLSVDRAEEAKNLLISCVSLYPTNQLCNGNLTNVFFNTPEAMKYFDLCLKNTPNNALCKYNLAGFQFMKHDYKKSYASFKELEGYLDSDEGGIQFAREDIYLNIGLNARELGLKKEARSYLDKACSLGQERACTELEATK
ncbi:lipopolysaccharide assembly protein LapB [Bacteriovorax sp. Seq25_V]|uniref:tetratricopeptide repeat protein n=1 Tax=Bacteriovorax sp. Seq25_V TaxID=1201288 RepID=UPI000389E7C1|nr:hypothetical protein [Bacteriovorax sp. Seq25_V]EQC44662.1 hypothetical protein M900_0347 [Bacteriovorax sp. Seq25_V]